MAKKKVKKSGRGRKPKTGKAKREHEAQMEEELNTFPIIDFKSAYQKSGMSYTDIALGLGLSENQRSNVSNWINGHKNMTWIQIKRLAEVFDVDIRDLLRYE